MRRDKLKPIIAKIAQSENDRNSLRMSQFGLCSRRHNLRLLAGDIGFRECGWRRASTTDCVARCGLPTFFSTALGPLVAYGPKSKSFPVVCKSYKEPEVRHLCFQQVADGTLVALVKGRRSGAQRGASENNFGQRFSVSTPCFPPAASPPQRRSSPSAGLSFCTSGRLLCQPSP